MDKTTKYKNQVTKILNQIATKRFSKKEKIALIVIILICVLIGNHFFNQWIVALKNKNNIVIPLSPPIEPKLPNPIVVKQVKIEPPDVPETKIKKLRDPFVSSKNPRELKTIKAKKNSVELKLSGILWDDKIPSAIINSRVVKIGDLIEGKTVVDIEKKQVVVMEEGEIFVLELGEQ